jgi:hypothetical protein
MVAHLARDQLVASAASHWRSSRRVHEVGFASAAAFFTYRSLDEVRSSDIGAGDVEVLLAAQRLDAVVRVVGNLLLAEEILLDSVPMICLLMSLIFSPDAGSRAFPPSLRGQARLARRAKASSIGRNALESASRASDEPRVEFVAKRDSIFAGVGGEPDELPIAFERRNGPCSIRTASQFGRRSGTRRQSKRRPQ